MVETDEEKKVREEKEEAEKKAAEEAKEKEEADAEAAKASAKEESKVKSPLEEARALDKSIKEGAERMKKLLEKNEKIFADAALAGKGFAGQGDPPKESEDEKWAREAKVRYEGTGLDPTPDADTGPTKYS